MSMSVFAEYPHHYIHDSNRFPSLDRLGHISRPPGALPRFVKILNQRPERDRWPFSTTSDGVSSGLRTAPVHIIDHKDRACIEVPVRSGYAKKYTGIVRDCPRSSLPRKGSAFRLTSARGCAFRQVLLATENKSSIQSLLIIMAVI